MEVYVVVLDGKSLPEKWCFTSLKGACELLGVEYGTVRRKMDMRYWCKNGSICKIEVIKVAGRGRKG